MELSSLFETCFVIMALMLVGFFAAQGGVIPQGYTRVTSFLIVNIFLTATIFQSFCVGGDLSPAELPKVLLAISLMILVCYVLARVTVQLAGKRLGDPAPAELCMGVMNNLLIGLPLLSALFGSTAVLYAGLTSLPFNVLLYTYGVWRLGTAGGRGGGVGMKDILSPCIYATLAGLAVFLFRLPVPGFVSRLMGTAAGVSMPLSMIVIGITMGSEDLAAALKDRRVYLAALVRLVLAPALVWVLLRPLGLSPLLLKACTVIAGCPTGIVVPILTLQYGHEPTFASNCVIVTTLLSLLTLPLLLILLG